MKEQSSQNSAIKFPTLLFLVFLVLKLTHVIDWSWWWITAPLWGGVALIFVFSAIIATIVKLLDR